MDGLEDNPLARHDVECGSGPHSMQSDMGVTHLEEWRIVHPGERMFPLDERIRAISFAQ